MAVIDKHTSFNFKITPESFLKRRIKELCGLLVLSSVALLMAAFLTYNASDASLNSANSGLTANILGFPGAVVSDLLIQMIGLTNGMLVIVLSFWGVRLLVHKSFNKVIFRLLLLPIGLVLLSGAVAQFSLQDFWKISSGVGGVVGSVIYNQIIPIVAPYHISPDILSLILGSFGITILFWCMGAGFQDWLIIFFSVARYINLTSVLLVRFSIFSARALGVGCKVTAKVANNSLEKTKQRMEPNLVQDNNQLNNLSNRLDVPSLEVDVGVPVILSQNRVENKRKGKEKINPKIVQENLNLQVSGEYSLPQLGLLAYQKEVINSAPDKQTLEANARMLETVLQDFGIKGEIVKVRPGPVVTLYELEPAPGTRSSRVIGLADDIARSMSAVSVRVAVVPGLNVIGIELPNPNREMVFLRELFETKDYSTSKAKLPIALGKDISGDPIVVDLAKMPHLLIAGTTGSGKSVAVNTMILSLLYKLSPENCRMIMIDPKMLELSIYDNIPHLLSPVVTDPKKAVVALKWTVREMETRYRAMSKLGVRNIDGYNARLADARKKGEVLKRRVQTGFDAETGRPVYEDQPLDLTPIPFIVVIIDEVADLMLVAGKDIEGAVQRLAQMARAAGIHVIMATQRPSVDVITGTIKANFPTRISFQVTSKIDSRTILGEQGAEQLLGQGDMLHMAGGGRVTRVHGPFVSDEEVEDVVAHLRSQGEPEFNDSITEEDDVGDPLAAYGLGAGEKDANNGDGLYDKAIAIVAQERKASTSFIQRHLKIGYNRAATIIERMEADGVVSAANHVGKREVLLPDHAEL
jgi:DNA segregation ATPase FtsK/SpoIIIE, S-DNA-T family